MTNIEDFHYRKQQCPPPPFTFEFQPYEQHLHQRRIHLIISEGSTRSRISKSGMAAKQIQLDEAVTKLGMFEIFRTALSQLSLVCAILRSPQRILTS